MFNVHVSYFDLFLFSLFFPILETLDSVAMNIDAFVNWKIAKKSALTGKTKKTLNMNHSNNNSIEYGNEKLLICWAYVQLHPSVHRENNNNNDENENNNEPNHKTIFETSERAV